MQTNAQKSAPFIASQEVLGGYPQDSSGIEQQYIPSPQPQRGNKEVSYQQQSYQQPTANVYSRVQQEYQPVQQVPHQVQQIPIQR